MKKRKFSKKERKPSQRVLISIIVGTIFSIVMGIMIWLAGQEISPGTYHIVLIILGIGMSVVLISFVIIYIIMRKSEKAQEKNIRIDSGLITEEKDLSMEQSASTLTKFLNIPYSTEPKPIERECEYCGHETVTEGEICPKCNKYAIIKNMPK